MSSSKLFSLSALGLFLVLAPACTDDESTGEPAGQVTEAVGFAVDPMTSGENFAGFENALGRFSWLAAKCDPEASFDTIEKNGTTLMANGSFEWSECAVNFPNRAHRQDAPMKSMTSSGHLEIETTTNDEGAYKRTATFDIERSNPQGMSMHMTGTSTTEETEIGSNEYVITLDQSRQMQRKAGAGPSMHMTGELHVIVSDDNSSQTVNGTMEHTINTPHSGTRHSTIELTKVLRVNHEECEFPVGGSIVRNTDGDTHTLKFSSTCGIGTLDGAKVDLTELSQRMGGKNGHMGKRGM